MTLTGQKVLVVGLGESGLSMARFCAHRGASLVRVIDTRSAPPGLAELRASVPQADVRLGAFARPAFEGIDLIAMSPGVPLADPQVSDARARGTPVTGDIELFAQALPRHPRPKVIAITGTNGKTTVSALTGSLARAAGVDAEVAGNISPAALDAYMARTELNAAPEAWVLELSSYQLETTATLAPDAATMLNLSEDHLDRYRDLAAYGAAKARIFQGDGVQVLNRDDPASIAMRQPHREVVTFGLDAAPSASDFGLRREPHGWTIMRGDSAVIGVAQLQLAGLHNAANAMAALALVSAAYPEYGGLEHDVAVLAALAAFRGLAHRVERIGALDGITYYDDSKGTNVGSTIAALTGLGGQLAPHAGKVVLIAGGEGKGQDFAPLLAPVTSAARAVVLIGRDGPRIGAAIHTSGVAVTTAATLAQAIDQARGAASPGDAVLLSPACASFDMFKSYKDRGEQFAAIVRAMGAL